MHLFVSPDDRIHGAGRQTARAADAGLLVDLRHELGSLDTVGGIQRQRPGAQQPGERADGGGAARRTLVDGRLAGGDRRGVGAAARIAAARALRLRQQGIDFVGLQVILMPGVAPASADSRNGPSPAPLAASTMPSETPNFILRGARFATTTVSRPARDAGS